MPRRMAYALVVGVNCISDLCNSIICNRAPTAGTTRIDNRVMLCSPCNGAKGATLTISGLVRANKRDGWLESEARRKVAYDSARLVGEMFKEKEREALIKLVCELAIERERQITIERVLAPIEMALGI